MTTVATAAGEQPAGEAGAGLTLSITREFDAPRELVFELWTQPEHLRHWWGPRDEQRRDFSTPHVAQDFREGGDWRICMVSPAGKEYWSSGSYSEVDPPQRIAFSFTWDAASGQPAHRTEVTVDFAELPDGRTRMDFRQSPFFTAFDRDDHTGGWNDCFDRLAELLQRMEAGNGQ